MYYYRIRKITAATLLCLLLFTLGRFYKEVNMFLNDIYSLLGLSFIVIALLCCWVFKKQQSIIRWQNYRDEEQRECNEWRKNYYDLHTKYHKLKAKKK